MNNAVSRLVKTPSSSQFWSFLFLMAIHLIDNFYRHGALKALHVKFLNDAELFIQLEKVEAPLM